ncbi:MAG: DUF1611 domain-containing protein [Alphaproteobacteria bacterium]|nr:MAG: DUF1611 domain-containing protein [Alphaproteobacteria bacterium]
MQIATPYLLFLGDAPDDLAAKTARGILHWRSRNCLGQIRLAGCNADLGLPDMTIPEAAAAGVKSMVIGVANAGGVIPDHWTDTIVEALEAGLDVASGLHHRLADNPAIADAARRAGRSLFDVRHPRTNLTTGTGAKRPGKRLLTVGTDCSVGKMFASLAIEAEMQARGLKADFRATGQTGILIAGSGISVDAVVADFISGAAEMISPANDPDHWDIVEGQGSLFHPSFAGVSLGLLHGSQPDALVLCHEPTRRHMRGLPHAPLPDLGDCLAANLQAARLTNPAVRAIGVAVNTSRLDDTAARDCLARIADDLGLPATDPVRYGAGPLVDALEG